jgi:DUF1365 family protein
MSELELNSCFYHGRVWHRRISPRLNEFTYNVFMAYLDLDEIDLVFSRTGLWQNVSRADHQRKFWPPVQFSNRDYFDGQNRPLGDAIRDWIAEQGHPRPEGAVRMLANVKMWGYLINPIVCYYVFDKSDNLRHVVAEVTNTPWRDRIQYLLPVTGNSGINNRRFGKDMHVSPFMPMDMEYEWTSNLPGETLELKIDNWRNGDLVFNAAMAMKREPISKASKNKILRQFPWMTAKVAAAIYWQALKLFVKRVPLFGHPKSIVRNG